MGQGAETVGSYNSSVATHRRGGERLQEARLTPSKAIHLNDVPRGLGHMTDVLCGRKYSHSVAVRKLTAYEYFEAIMTDSRLDSRFPGTFLPNAHLEAGKNNFPPGTSVM
jgi:hypothetical protein